jgi:hypothetical protein
LQSGEDLRQRRWQHDLPHDLALVGAHVARRPQQFLLDCGNATKRRCHDWKDRVEYDDGDFGEIIDAKPENDDRQERDFGHRETD